MIKLSIRLFSPPSRHRTLTEWFATLPSLGWLTIFFLIPTLIIFAIVFKPADPFGGVGSGWTMKNLNFSSFNYYEVIARTFWLSFFTTLICLLLAIPIAYYMARLSEKWRNILLMLIIVPFWTSFLVRIFAWKVLLHPEGVIKKVFVWTHLLSSDSTLLYTPGAVLLVMVYTYLPFAILPLYAAAEKFDFQLIEAARDLGAHSFQAFYAIFLPGVKRGIITAILMVLIPALGSYVIPDLVGGPNGEMIGNKIAQRTFVDRNLPQASWLSALLILVVLVPLIITLFLQKRKSEKNILIEEGL